MALRPLPNMMFLRDPCISTYDRVVVGRMANASRARETLLVAFALTHTKNGAVQLSFAKPEGAGEAFGSVEGGDVLVLSPKLMMIGCSERTHPQTLERLATHGLFPDHPRLERIYAVMMPQARSVMHLDTILTQIDRQLVLGHAPLIEGAPGRPPLAVARLERNEPPVLVSSASVLDVLREELGADLGFVACGGDDPLHQEREQWTDGANAVALAPGQIILYARNTKTIDALADHDFTEVRLSLVQPAEQRATAVRDAMKAGRTVFTFSGSELSRARGGGRCLTMPLVRAHLHDDDT
jgi:arginine deiminase